MDYTPKAILNIKSRASGMSPKMQLIAKCVCRHPEFIVNRKVRETGGSDWDASPYSTQGSSWDSAPGGYNSGAEDYNAPADEY